MKRNKIFFFFLIFFWFVVIYNIFISSIPIPTTISYIKKNTIFNMVPQGWGFFTRNPREDEILFYKIDSISNQITLSTKTNNSLEFYLGASRKNRFIGIEMDFIHNKVPKKSWKKGDTKKFSFDFSTQADTIKSNFNVQNLSGHYFIVKQQRTPWAWGRNYKKIIMHYEYSKVYIPRN